MTHSGSWPLSLKFHCTGSNEKLPELLSPVVLHRSRWEHLTLSCPKHTVWLIDGPMPSLRSLHLSLQTRRLPKQPQLILRDVPLLRKVVLNSAAASYVSVP
ncbi:hypothetical protein R3P38DRAFT_306311 [Favolaschia claudopus]|uniref:Uncharacterized protein n=1 Tax=Favolaschia claudopus TaxID=2862362 RepID=A0AAW0CSD2_9AGAR